MHEPGIALEETEAEMSEKLLTVQEVGCKIGVSIQSIGCWYKFKRENPESPYAAMLPEFVRMGGRNTRYWKESDLPALKHFHETIPMGRNGVLGSVTQRYTKKPEGTREKFRGLYSAKKEAGNHTRMMTDVELLLSKYGVETGDISSVLELLEQLTGQKLQAC